MRSDRVRMPTPAEAANEAKLRAQDVAMLRTQVQRMRCVMQAMWQILQTRMNVNEAELMAAADAIEAAERAAPRQAEQCPTCSRALQDSSAFCIYCGTKVGRRSLF